MTIGPEALGWAVPRRLELRTLLDRGTACCLWLTLCFAGFNGGWLLSWPPGSGGPLHLYWFDLTMAAALALWGCRLALYPNTPFTLGHPLPVTVFAGLIALAMVGVPFSAQPAAALGMAGRLWLLGLFYLCLLNARQPIRRLTSALLCSLAAQALVALAQTAHQRSLGLFALGEPRLDPAQRGIAVAIIHGHRWLRAYGLTDHPNLLGGMAVVTGLFLAAAAPRSWRRQAVGSLVVVLLSTLSRGAWLAGGVGALALLAMSRSGRVGRSRSAPTAGRESPQAVVKLIAIGVAVVAGAAAFTLRFNLGNRLEVQSLQARAVEMGQAISLIARHPLTGVGANCYPIALGRIVSPATYAPYGVPVVHNIFLLSAAELGVLAPGLLAALLLGPLWCSFRDRRGGTEAGAAVGLAACAVLGLTDFSPWASPGFRLLWLALLAVWAAERRPPTAIHQCR